MSDHETWFHLIPILKALETDLGKKVGDGWLMGSPYPGLHHVFMGVFILLLLLIVGLRYKGALASLKEKAIIPDRTLTLRNFVEIVCDGVLGMMSGIMGEKAARAFLPFIGTFAFFILFANLLGLVPGFLPETDSLNTNLAMALPVFVATHVYGLKENGMGHIKHMLGPVVWLAPLMLVIELVSHIARPVSLAVRLAGNMIGDHKALSIFLGLTYFLIPVPIMALGVIVCLVQTLVFCLLSAVYIGMAIEHQDHGEAHAH